MDKTFNIRTGKDATKPHPYELEFEHHGHIWVVHERLLGVGFRVSHKDTGYGVPGSLADTALDAQVNGMAMLDAKADQIEKVIMEVTT